MAEASAGRAPTRTWMLTALVCVAVIGAGYAVISATNTPTLQERAAGGTDANGDDWAVTDGFALDVDASGFRFPTSIAFVPDPGPGPKDPLYFVTELRGRVKVVTNDRTVLTFAEDFFDLHPRQELPAISGEVGMAGLCLEPEHGYVFVTFVHENENGELRNRIVRFRSKPGTFSTEPIDWQPICPLLDEFPGSVSHLIGPLLVRDDLLYVSVGDSRLPAESRNLHSPLGKILRMTLDGEPAPGNPHKVDDDPARAINYVYASGLRNAFSLSVAHGRILVGDNGPEMDRFLELHEGADYGYDGTNASIGTNAVIAMLSASPTQTEFLPEDSTLFPEFYRGAFFCCLSGSPGARPGESSIALIRYDFERNRAADRPRTFLRLRSNSTRVLLALAFGRDGVYFTSLLPDADGHSSVMRVSWDPERTHRHVIGKDMSADELLTHYRCVGCHDLHGDQPGRRGPTLRPGLETRLLERLGSDGYRTQVAKLDASASETIAARQPWRARVLELSGRERVRYWIERHLLDPKFDNTFAQMPDFGMSEEHAGKLASHFVDREGPGSPSALTDLRRLIGRVFPVSRGELALLMLAIGIAATLLIRALIGMFRRG